MRQGEKKERDRESRREERGKGRREKMTQPRGKTVMMALSGKEQKQAIDRAVAQKRSGGGGEEGVRWGGGRAPGRVCWAGIGFRV